MRLPNQGKLKGGSLKETVYTPEAHLGFRWTTWREMAVGLVSSRGLTWRLFVRQISARYRQSVLGYFWALLPAIATVVTFSILNRSNVVSIGETNIPYPAYVLLGLSVWQLFSSGITSTAASVSSAGDMIKKVRFPHESLVLAAFGQSILDFMIRLALLVVVFAWFRVELVSTVLLTPLILLGLSVLTVGCGFLLALMNAVFRDVGKVLAIVMTFGMFLTPVVYPPPISWPASLINYVNPVSGFVIAAQDLTTRGYLTHPEALLSACVVAIVVFVVGWRTFHVVMPRIVERV